MTTWYTDRSRYEEGFKCPTSRYFKYHHAGTGIVKKGTYLPLATGITIHEALADTLRNCVGSNLSEVSLQEKREGTVRQAIRKAVRSYKEGILAAGFLDDNINEEDNQRIIQEQSNLVEGLVWGWSLVMLPELLSQFEILAVEQEELFTLNTPELEIKQMSRPDFVARRKSDGRIGVHDFKSTSTIDDTFVKQFFNSVQMAVGTLGVDRLKEKVDHYYVHALVKGTRTKSFDSDSSSYSGPRVQNSIFSYGYRKLGVPPFEEGDWKPTWKYTDILGKSRTLGRGYEKTPTHEYPGGVEAWVKSLPKSLLFEQFAIIGPYDRQDYLIQDYLSALGTVETGYAAALVRLKEAQSQQTVQYNPERVSALFPRSYQCFDRSGNRCQYYDICFRGEGWQDPLGSGKYVRREPHHTTEEV